MNLESPKINVQKSAADLFDFLTNVENYESIMPENTAKFEARDNAFIFALKGMPEIKLQLQEQVPHHKIVLGSGSDKFPFTLTGNITEIDANTSDIQLFFEGSFNPMMTMMIKGPLQRFIDTLAENLQKTS